jgi:transcriptional regulator with XRE-family HTH domain
LEVLFVQKDETKNAITLRLFALLDERHISTSDFSRQLGVPQGTVSGWKNRGSLPSADLIPRICTTLGVSVEWFLTGIEQPFNSNVVCAPLSGSSSVVQGFNHSMVFVRNGSEHALTDEAVELLRIYETLSPKQRHKLLGVAFEMEEETTKKDGSHAE